MPDTTYLVAAVLLSAAVTWALRALPSAALAPLRASGTVQYLSTRMPAGIMVMLVVYCLRDLPLTHARVAAPWRPWPSPSACICGAATPC
ncbi:branched-chain amino acid transporter permease [Streptomyces sp. NPDC001450]